MKKQEMTITRSYMGADGRHYDDEPELVHVDRSDEELKEGAWTTRYEFKDPVTGKIYQLEDIQDMLDHIRDHRHDFIDNLVEQAKAVFPNDDAATGLRIKTIDGLAVDPLYSVWWDCLPGWMKGPYNVKSPEDLERIIRLMRWYDNEIAPDLVELLDQFNIKHDEPVDEDVDDDEEDDEEDEKEDNEMLPPPPESITIDAGMPTISIDGVVAEGDLVPVIGKFLFENLLLSESVGRVLDEKANEDNHLFVIGREFLKDEWTKDSIEAYFACYLNQHSEADGVLFDDWTDRVKFVSIKRYTARKHWVHIQFHVPALMKLIPTRTKWDEVCDVTHREYSVTTASSISFLFHNGCAEDVLVEWDPVNETEWISRSRDDRAPDDLRDDEDFILHRRLLHYKHDGVLGNVYTSL